MMIVLLFPKCAGIACTPPILKQELCQQLVCMVYTYNKSLIKDEGSELRSCMTLCIIASTSIDHVVHVFGISVHMCAHAAELLATCL